MLGNFHFRLLAVGALTCLLTGCSCGSDDSADGTSSGGKSSGGGGTGGSGGSTAGGNGGTGAGTSGGGTGGTATGGVSGSGGAAGQGGQAGNAGASSDAGADAEGGVADSGSDAGPPMCTAAQPCSWKQAQPQTSPPTLAWAAAAYDPVHDQVILFGGAPTINGGTTTDETWAWNGTNWAKLTPNNKPGARWTAGMVFDESSQKIVLFGGLATDQVGSGLNDTWEWDGSDWSKVTTQKSPAPRGVHGALAYDSVAQKVILRGGGTFPGQTTFDDTWQYDGANWADVAGSGPSARVAPAIAYDKTRNEVILFGGGTWNPYYDDTWKFSGGVWTPLSPTNKPSARQSARAIFDASRSLVVLFGGSDANLLNDLWEWNGSDWAPVSVQGPPPRCCFAFAYDSKRGEAVLFGGPDDQTWIYGN